MEKNMELDLLALFNECAKEAKKGEQEDNVNHPKHYNIGDIEVIEYIKDKLTKEEYIGYCMGNVIKYVSRYKHKNGKEDLNKAMVYLSWAIEVM